MKTLFNKFRASVELDRGGKPEAAGPSGEVGPFAESLQAMDGNLRMSRGGTAIPPGLHTSIMRAVRTSGRERGPAEVVWLFRPIAVAVLMLMIGFGAVWFANRAPVKVADVPAIAEARPSFAAAFEQGRELTQTAPGTVLGPLSGEMDLLNRDLQNALNFVAANVP